MNRKFFCNIFLACTASLLLLSGHVFAQAATAGQNSQNNQPMPKDIVTRAKAHTELGALYFQEGNWVVGLEELTIAIAINPDYAPAYSIRGLVLYYVKEWESAEKDFQKALALNGRDPEINNNYGWYLCHTDRIKESISYFDIALDSPMYRTPETALLNRGMCLIKLKEFDQAEADIRRSLRFLPGNPQADYHLALISYDRGNYSEAKERLSGLITMNDPGAHVLWLALRTEQRLGNQMALSNFEALLARKYPESAEYQEFKKGSLE